MGASREGGGGAREPGPRPGGEAGGTGASSCFLSHSSPHFPLCSFPLPPTPSWLQRPWGRGPSPSGRFRGTSNPTILASPPRPIREMRGKKNSAQRLGRKALLLAGSAHGVGARPPAPLRLISLLLFPASLSLPFPKCPNRGQC